MDGPADRALLLWYGWAPSRVLPDMAFSVEANVYLATYLIYAHEAVDERYAEWVHSRTRKLAGVGCGVYLGDTDFQRRPDRFLLTRPSGGSARYGPSGTRTE